jgi:hypothetical protein
MTRLLNKTGPRAAQALRRPTEGAMSDVKQDAVWEIAVRAQSDWEHGTLGTDELSGYVEAAIREALAPYVERTAKLEAALVEAERLLGATVRNLDGMAVVLFAEVGQEASRIAQANANKLREAHKAIRALARAPRRPAVNRP